MAKLTKAEIKKTMATAIAAAFGFIIALLWRDAIIGMMKLAGLWAEGGYESWNDAIIGIVATVIITIVCVLAILLISRWGGAEE